MMREQVISSLKMLFKQEGLTNIINGLKELIGVQGQLSSTTDEIKKPINDLNKSFTKTYSVWLNLMFLGQNLNKMFGGLRDLIWQTYLSSAFLDLTFGMMAELAPIIDPLVDIVYDLIDGFYDLPGPLKFIISAFVLLIGVIVSVIPIITNLVLMNWALTASGMSVTGALTGMIGRLVGVGAAAWAAIPSLSGVMATLGGIASTIIALLPWMALLVGAVLLLSFVWSENIFGIQDILEEAAIAIEDRLDGLRLAIDGLLTQDWEMFSEGVNQMIEDTPLGDFATAWDELNGVFDSLNEQDFAGAKEHLNGFKDSLIEALVPDWLEEPVKNFVDEHLVPLYLDVFVPFVNGCIQAAADFKKEFIDPIINWAVEFYDGVTGEFGKAWDYFDREFLKPIKRGLVTLGRAIYSTAKKWYNWFYNKFIKPVQDKFDAMVTYVKDTIWNPLKTWLLDNIIAPLKKAWDDFGDAIEGVWDAIYSKIKLIWDKIKPIVDAVKDAAKKITSFTGRSAERGLKGAAGGIESFTPSNVGKVLGGVFENLKEGARVWSAALGKWVFGDFIMRPGMPPISISPNDTLIGMKDLSGLGGTGTSFNNTNISFNPTIYLSVSSIASPGDIENLKRELNESWSKEYNRLLGGSR